MIKSQMMPPPPPVPGVGVLLTVRQLGNPVFNTINLGHDVRKGPTRMLLVLIDDDRRGSPTLASAVLVVGEGRAANREEMG